MDSSGEYDMLSNIQTLFLIQYQTSSSGLKMSKYWWTMCRCEKNVTQLSTRLSSLHPPSKAQSLDSRLLLLELFLLLLFLLLPLLLILKSATASHQLQDRSKQMKRVATCTWYFQSKLQCTWGWGRLPAVLKWYNIDTLPQKQGTPELFPQGNYQQGILKVFKYINSK